MITRLLQANICITDEKQYLKAPEGTHTCMIRLDLQWLRQKPRRTIFLFFETRSATKMCTQSANNSRPTFATNICDGNRWEPHPTAQSKTNDLRHPLNSERTLQHIGGESLAERSKHVISNASEPIPLVDSTKMCPTNVNNLVAETRNRKSSSKEIVARGAHCTTATKLLSWIALARSPGDPNQLPTAIIVQPWEAATSTKPEGIKI